MINSHEVLETIAGTYHIPQEPIVLAVKKNGEEIIVDKVGFSRQYLRESLIKILDRDDIDEASRQNILNALKV